jgi:hypothetical protein
MPATPLPSASSPPSLLETPPRPKRAEPLKTPATTPPPASPSSAAPPSPPTRSLQHRHPLRHPHRELRIKLDGTFVKLVGSITTRKCIITVGSVTPNSLSQHNANERRMNGRLNDQYKCDVWMFYHNLNAYKHIKEKKLIIDNKSFLNNFRTF